MKKLIILAIVGSLLFGVDLDRRVELLENAVIKLIDENKKLKNEIYNLKNASKINTQMIFGLNNRVDKNEKEVNKLDRKLTKVDKKITTINKDNNATFYAKVTASMLNVREKPTTKSRVLGVLKRGDIVKIKKSIKNGKTIWYKVGNNKFISSNYTNLIKGE